MAEVTRRSQLEGGVLAPVDSSLFGGVFSTWRGSRTKEERESGKEGVTPEGWMFFNSLLSSFHFLSMCPRESESWVKFLVIYIIFVSSKSDTM